MPNSIVKYVYISFAAIFLLLLFFNVGVDGEYVYDIRIPDPYLGKIVPYYVKGIVVYITREQWNFIYWLRFSQFVTATIAFCAALVYRQDR